MLSCFSCVWLFVTPWTVAHQAPLSKGFSRQGYWSGLLCPPPGYVPNQGIEPMSLTCNLHWQADSLPLVSTGKPHLYKTVANIIIILISIILLHAVYGGSDGKESACQCRRLGFYPWVRKIPWRKEWLPTPVFLPGKPHKYRSLVGYSP